MGRKTGSFTRGTGQKLTNWRNKPKGKMNQPNSQGQKQTSAGDGPKPKSATGKVLYSQTRLKWSDKDESRRIQPDPLVGLG